MVCAAIGIVTTFCTETFILYKVVGSDVHLTRLWLGQFLLMGILLCYVLLFAYLLAPGPVACGIVRYVQTIESEHVHTFLFTQGMYIILDE